MSIQLVGAGSRAGLVFSPREVFQHKTPAALAATARAEEDATFSATQTTTANSPPLPSP